VLITTNFATGQELGTSCISVDNAGVVGMLASQMPSMSDDGRFVVFASDAANLVLADTNRTTDVFLRRSGSA
jgi:Tol biopolymer transport system component